MLIKSNTLIIINREFIIINSLNIIDLSFLNINFDFSFIFTFIMILIYFFTTHDPIEFSALTLFINISFTAYKSLYN